MTPLSPRSIFSEERHFGVHDAAVKALRARALELMSKVARSQRVGNPSAEARYLAEARMLQTAASWLATAGAKSESKRPITPSVPDRAIAA